MIAFMSIIDNEKNRSILEQAYYLYRKRLVIIANDILNDKHAAEDVVQTAFIKFSDYIDEKTDIKCHKTRGLIVIIVRGLATDLYRQRKRRTTVNIDDYNAIYENQEEYIPEISLLNLDRSEWIVEKLLKLKAEYTDILVLKYMFEYTNKEIADICNITEDNVRTRLKRARRALSKIAGGEDHE